MFLVQYAVVAKRLKIAVLLSTFFLYVSYFAFTALFTPRSPCIFISISLAIRWGVDLSHDNELYRWASVMLLTSCLICNVLVEFSSMLLYTTTFITSNCKRSIYHVTSLVGNCAGILALAITVQTEGNVLHLFPSAVYFTSTVVLRLLMFKEDTDSVVSRWQKLRIVFTICAGAPLLSAISLPRTHFTEMVIGLTELVALALVIWDKCDLLRYISRYHSQVRTSEYKQLNLSAFD